MTKKGNKGIADRKNPFCIEPKPEKKGDAVRQEQKTNGTEEKWKRGKMLQDEPPTKPSSPSLFSTALQGPSLFSIIVVKKPNPPGRIPPTDLMAQPFRDRMQSKKTPPGLEWPAKEEQKISKEEEEAANSHVPRAEPRPQPPSPAHGAQRIYHSQGIPILFFRVRRRKEKRGRKTYFTAP